MLWTILAALILLAWTATFVTTFCPLRAMRRRQEARELAAQEKLDHC
jgi:hypothetical protein